MCAQRNTNKSIPFGDLCTYIDLYDLENKREIIEIIYKVDAHFRRKVENGK